MSYKNGKKITLLGFGLDLLINIGFILNFVVINVFHLPTNVLGTLLDYGLYLSIGLAALGFLVMWLSGNKMIDFLTCGATGISALLGLLSCLGIINSSSPFSRIIISSILSAFYIVLALRAKKFNVFLSLLLVCAFIYETFSYFIFVDFLFLQVQLPHFLVFLVSNVGYAICAGFAFAEVKAEK